MQQELKAELRAAFERVYERGWYIRGIEDETFEKAFARYCGVENCVGTGKKEIIRLQKRSAEHS